MTTKEINGVIYVTADFAEEMLGVRAVYEPGRNMLKLKGEKLFYTVLGTNVAHFGGEEKTLTNAVTSLGGRVYIPVTLFSDIYGYNVKTDGGVAVFGQSVSDGALKTAKGLAF